MHDPRNLGTEPFRSHESSCPPVPYRVDTHTHAQFTDQSLPTQDMRQQSLLLLSAAALGSIASSEVRRPRGVGPEFAKYYKDPSTFTCITNPSVTLTIAQLNDDYCDCPDGSDEPGTAACSHLSPLSPHTQGDSVSGSEQNRTPALPGFYCRNKGHQPSYIPFTNLNDGVCDYDQCCDGSDEWAHAGGIKCEDKCKEIGKEWRKHDEARQKSMGVATKRRKELASEAVRLRQEVVNKIETLEKLIEGAEVKITRLQGDLAETERQERGKIVKKPKEGGKLGSLVQLAKDRMVELREALVEVRGERDLGRSRVEELEAILKTFKEEYNPNFNDEGVKRAVRAWEDYAAKDKAAIGSDARDRDLDEIAKSEEEAGTIKWADYAEEEESDADVLYQLEAYLPPAVRKWVDDKLRSFRLLLIENGILANSHDPSTESPALEAARNALSAAEGDLNNDKKALEDSKSDLDKDYGTSDIFRALKDKCVEKDSGEYTYELCWLGSTKQKSKKGGAHTLMGSFVSFDRTTVDDELPVDGKGLGAGERVVLKYENGQHCWNGPNRATTVVLACSENEEIWKITEEEKCIYRMEVGTSAVCGTDAGEPSGGDKGAAKGVKDEL